MKERFLFTGTGGSVGIPVIGCSCAVCLSSSPENKRQRTAGILFAQGKTILVDVGPDFRAQMLAHKIPSVDGLIITHTHADHTAGFDDLRVFFFRQKGPIPCLLSAESLEDMRQRFHYVFPPFAKNTIKQMTIEPHVLEHDFGRASIVGVPLLYFSFYQNQMKIMGFRYKDFAYLTDIQEYTKEIFAPLQGVKTLVLSALRKGHSNSHFTVADAVKFAHEVGATKTWITHISHELEHDSTNSELPEHVRLAYDGLEVPIE